MACLVAASVASALAGSPAAKAATASVRVSQHGHLAVVRYLAGAGELNRLRVEQPGGDPFRWLFTDPSATITAGGGCTVSADRHQADCRIEISQVSQGSEHAEIALRDGDDTGVLSGVSEPVKLDGGSGDDALTGGSTRDWIYGGPDDDTVEGGPGDDTISGGHGTNRLDLTGDYDPNAEHSDSATCQSRRDTVVADPDDYVGRTCRHVSGGRPRRLDIDPPGLEHAQAAGLELDVSLLSQYVSWGPPFRTRTGFVSFPARCYAAMSCTGRILLRVRGRTIGSGRYSLGPGRHTHGRVSLNARGRALLTRRRHVSADVVIAARGRAPVRVDSIRLERVR